MTVPQGYVPAASAARENRRAEKGALQYDMYCGRRLFLQGGIKNEYQQ